MATLWPNVVSIRPLNFDERHAIGQALYDYIKEHGDKKAWAQKAVFDEMLHGLMFAEIKENAQ